MKRRLSAVSRASLMVAAVIIAAAGLAFASRGDGDSPPSAQPASPAAEGVATGPAATAPPPTPSPAPAEATAPANEPTASPVPSPTVPPETAAATPVIVTQPTPAPAQPPPPLADDIPKYSDVAVLALAADAILPSGITFRECVELPPSHEKWPMPVHLYYEGRGRWLVETHVSEVQVVFDEPTATFTTRNFAPVNPACR